VNEDGHGTFEFPMSSRSMNCVGMWVADGHGEVVAVPKSDSEPWVGSKAQQFVAILRSHIAQVVEEYVGDFETDHKFV
jgi:hypothetical protein